MPQPLTRSRQTGHPGYSRTLPREPASVCAARRLVRGALVGWGLEELADDGALIVSELVANAVLHARRDSVRVSVDRSAARRVRVAVVDFSPRPPVATDPGPWDEGGRGLTLVAALAVDWGSEPLPWGKRVWAEVAGRA
ncbi:ATP-binding protein [Streptomyces sp. NPDC058417]|uniref:ATP-binding protein n=1 Tax=unclassified Streptomyces TaxID=2593676 RepID=UPI0036599DEA